MQIRDSFAKIRPVPLKQEVLIPKEKRVPHRRTDRDWFDKQTSNPGQAGVSFKIDQNRL